MRKTPLFCILCTAAALAGPALADGAFPAELSVYLPPNAPSRIMLGTNFGLVLSEDGGKSWRFTCELFITNDVNDNVVYYKIASDGAVLAVTLVYLYRSSDGGCSWTRAAFSAGSLYVTDAFIDPNDPKFVVAIATTASASQSGIYPSHDGGLSFGAALYTTSDRLIGLEIARSAPGVIYATQISAAGNSWLLKSTDSGATWTPQQLQGLAPSTQPYLAAVDPDDAGKVYLRLLTYNTSTDTLAVTTDDGKTLTALGSLTGGNTFFSSFLRANDKTVYAGTTTSDLYVQAPGQTMLSKRAGPRTRCLGQRQGEARIYACGNMYADGFSLGTSDDQAQTFQPTMKFTDIIGPLSCPAVYNACYSQFLLLQQTLGVGLDGGTAGNGGGKPGHCASAGGEGTLAVLLLLAFSRSRRRMGKQ